MDTPSTRNPFVERVGKEVASGFVIGGAFNSAYHYDNGGVQRVCNNLPRIGRASCTTAGFFGIFGAIDYAMVSARGKREPMLDCAVGAAVASGIMDLPKGLRCAGRSALIGGALGGILLGGTLMLLEDWSRNLPARTR